MGFNSAFKGLKLLKKNPGNGRLNNLNDPVLNVLTFSLWCCTLCGPGGERIVDIVPGGTELELQLRR